MERAPSVLPFMPFSFTPRGHSILHMVALRQQLRHHLHAQTAVSLYWKRGVTSVGGAQPSRRRSAAFERRRAALETVMYEEDRHRFEEDRHLFEEDRHLFEEDRHPFEEDRHPFEEDRHPFEEDRHPFGEDRHPFEEGRYLRFEKDRHSSS